jgi:nucleoside-diphosphate-sugar epimerase
MKAKQQINYEPKVDLDEGLRRFFLWTEENYTITESE